MSTGPIIVEQILNASASKVWKAISDRDEMAKWYFDLKAFLAEPGFEFQFEGGPDDRKYLHLCKVIEVENEKRLSYSWRYDGYAGNSIVSFDLHRDGDRTRLKLTHSGVDTFPKDNPDFARENFVQGWTEIIGTSLPGYLQKN